MYPHPALHLAKLARVLMEAQDRFFAADVAVVSRHVSDDTSLYLPLGLAC
jgi:hypothetical protein